MHFLCINAALCLFFHSVQSPVVSLNADNFASSLADGYTFVNYFQPW